MDDRVDGFLSELWTVLASSVSLEQARSRGEDAFQELLSGLYVARPDRLDPVDGVERELRELSDRLDEQKSRLSVADPMRGLFDHMEGLTRRELDRLTRD